VPPVKVSKGCKTNVGIGISRVANGFWLCHGLVLIATVASLALYCPVKNCPLKKTQKYSLCK
jgi:hypothetical protein